jgi:hypothetical protein
VVEGVVNEGADIPDFIKRFSPSFPVGKANPLGALDYLQMNPSVRAAVPYMVFIDRKGVIRSQFIGSDPMLADEAQQDKRLRAEAEKYLSESSAPAKTKAKSASR